LPTPRSLFPSTTLFPSDRGVRPGGTDLDLLPALDAERHQRHDAACIGLASVRRDAHVRGETPHRACKQRRRPRVNAVLKADPERSEEHTSELQSPYDLV